VTPQTSLELGVIGNGTASALIDSSGRYVWACVPHFAGDPVFCALLEPNLDDQGYFDVVLENTVATRQRYVRNTAVLITELEDAAGNIVEITDFCPRFRKFERLYHPVMFVRQIRPLSGSPQIRVRLRPLRDWGSSVPERTSGSNHVRWLVNGTTLRLTSDIAVPFIEHELPLTLDRTYTLVLGPDETLTAAVDTFANDCLEETRVHWFRWTRSLSIPFEWQDAVIRAAITLKLCQYEGTGAIVAAMTTSLPESADSGRTWDYRYCWLRDAAFVIRALNRLGATTSMEDYLRYIYTIAAASGELQPVYGIHFEAGLDESEVTDLRGYRGMGPVRRGNAAYDQKQHDVYGSVVLGSTHLFYDQRLVTPGDEAAFEQLESAGEQAYRLYDQPDAGIWEFRGRMGIHTYSSVMSWVACDRLARIARRLGRDDRAPLWRTRADEMRERIMANAYDEERGAFTETWGGSRLDASLLMLVDLGFVSPTDPRFLGTLDAVETNLKRGDYVFRYVDADDFGEPDTAFLLCTFWYINALAAVGRAAEARELFDRLLSRRNPLGLLSEDIHPADGQLWGNFPQTYSMVGIIEAAMRLSRAWDSEL
jgi:GH15 family glucan-1,4-alpha-glucosidase